MSTTPPNYPEGRDLLKAKTVLVTASAGTGIGFATAKRCVEEGAIVVLSDHHERRLAEAAESLGALSEHGVTAIPCDVTKDQEVRRLFASAIDTVGPLDVVVNNAGLGGTAEVAEMSDAQWEKVMDVTLNGTFRCMRAALQSMIERKRGVIVNNASVLGWRAQKGQAHYAAAKAGVMALTRCTALEVAQYNIRINAVAPSLAIHPHLSKVTSEELLKSLEAKEAFGRAAAPWEIANVIIFLASDYASYMTGEVVSVSNQHP